MQKTRNTTAAAGIAGAIIGAGVTAAAVALSDKKTREKISARIVDVKKKAEKALENAGNKTETLSKDAKKVLEDEKKMLEDIPPKTAHPLEQ